VNEKGQPAPQGRRAGAAQPTAGATSEFDETKPISGNRFQRRGTLRIRKGRKGNMPCLPNKANLSDFHFLNQGLRRFQTNPIRAGNRFQRNMVLLPNKANLPEFHTLNQGLRRFQTNPIWVGDRFQRRGPPGDFCRPVPGLSSVLYATVKSERRAGANPAHAASRAILRYGPIGNLIPRPSWELRLRRTSRNSCGSGRGGQGLPRRKRLGFAIGTGGPEAGRVRRGNRPG